MALRIVVCAKEVLDPDAVNNYALEGKLVIGNDGKSLTQSSIPRLMNAYDEQAIEAALRIREAGVACTITVVSVGDPGDILKHAASLGIDEPVAIQADTTPWSPSEPCRPQSTRSAPPRDCTNAASSLAMP